MKLDVVSQISSRATRLAAVGLMAVTLAACAGGGLFGPPKIKEEPVIPAATLYQGALDDMDRQYYQTAIKKLEQLERQHPRDPMTEKSKLMQVYAHYRIGKFDQAILAADRFLAIYPNSKDVPYVLYLKGTSYFGQIKDITRDQQLSRDAIDTYNLLVSNYPRSEYAADAKEKLLVAYDQLAGKEMSVGRYYLGNGQYSAAMNRFREVVEKWQTSTHIEEALYRLTETYLLLGLTNEAMSAAAVLGHNYPASDWYKRAFDVLGKQGLAPNLNSGSWLAGFRR
ncbi:MAG: outer membrane protein assembly factor BamD [Devosia sp.]|uniref:outer membrane protein assembly factor BamD n=1 Tax=unclassified Devosia TaxID=196773 RepID=UPI0019E6951C|nr:MULTISPECIES: outer membrane protein assembly factor BamD [unclassified Devosia]MBF0679375.1 outer membrane protein assembly factor BamD [Devosia sp.]WEJ34713.1 outer membrane protein assembly factor BamD [Devosia sp. SD17-2]